MSRPTQDQIDFHLEIIRSHAEKYGPDAAALHHQITRALADDLKAAREAFELETSMRTNATDENARLKAENDAMAALLERTEDYQATDHCDGIDGDEPSEECYDETPCWGHRVAAILAARAKRMGEKAAGR